MSRFARIGTEVKLYAWTRIDVQALVIALATRSVHCPPGVKQTCGAAAAAATGKARSRNAAIGRLREWRARSGPLIWPPGLPLAYPPVAPVAECDRKFLENTW
jgi:hypothetical protein